MQKITRDTFLLFIGSFFGSLMGLSVNLIYSDINNKGSWIMFFVTLIIIFLSVQFLLGLLHKVKEAKK